MECITTAKTYSSPIREEQLQRLWFEEWFKNPIECDDGMRISVIQTGFWNRGAGPDFTHAAYRDSEGKIHLGAIEIHLDAKDWINHGHHLDPRYDEVILHGVWKSSSVLTRTSSGKIVPQIDLSRSITLSSGDLAALFSDQKSLSSISSKPGLCHHTFMQSDEKNLVPFVEEAGWFRLLQKSRRLFLRQKTVGMTQTLWESLSEGCGYSKNRIAFRALSQRLRASHLIGLPSSHRKALLLGIAGFLPRETHLDANQPPELRHEARSIWEWWWRSYSHWSHALLPATQWHLDGVRPWNRPERRVAALSRLIPRLRSLKQSLLGNSIRDFRRELSSLHDPFWESHSTWNSAPQTPAPLIGAERLHDLETNLFWVWQIAHHQESIRSLLSRVRMTPNQKTRLAWQRIGGATKMPVEKETVLFQQGLIHLLQEFCFQDSSDCLKCPFPSMIRNSSLHENPPSSIQHFDEYRLHLRLKIECLEKHFKDNSSFPL